MTGNHNFEDFNARKEELDSSRSAKTSILAASSASSLSCRSRCFFNLWACMCRVIAGCRLLHCEAMICITNRKKHPIAAYERT